MRILLVDGFAEPGPIVAAAQRRLEANGHDVTVLGLVEAGFDRFMSAEERRAYHEPDNLVTEEQRVSADLVRTHDALLVCTPMRAGTLSPVVKSWFERVFIPEVSFTFSRSGRVKPALKRFRRVGMLVDCPDDDPEPHERGRSTRSVLRSIRLNSHKLCRTTYLWLTPDDDAAAKVDAALARW